MNASAGKAAYSHAVTLSIAALFLFIAAPASRTQTAANRAKKPATKSSSTAPQNNKPVAKKPAADGAEKRLAELSRALHDKGDAVTYEALAAFATQIAKTELGHHAALELGYYDLTKDRPDAAADWMRKAADDKVLGEYVQYYRAQTSLALGQKEEALEQLQKFRRDFPDSVMTEQAVTALAQTALAVDKSDVALAALQAYPGTESKPAFLLLRAEAREKLAAENGEKPAAAAADYLDLYYRFPLNEEAKIAGQKIPTLQFALGEEFPGTPMQTQIARAEAFYVARRWRDARTEYENLLPKLAGQARERAELRVAQCEVQSGGNLEILTSLALTDPELDAERIYTMSQVNRSQKLEPEMLDEVEQLAKRFPQSSWVDEALFATGNYYWVNLDRDRAAEYYRRTLDEFPDGKNASAASWRVAWTAYLDRKPEAADLLESYVRSFPTSGYVQDALYWLGRSYERSGNSAHARSFYVADATRFPLTYFGEKAAQRLRPEPDGIGAAPLNAADFLSVIPPAPALSPMDLPLSDKVVSREARARALSDIAFDSSAELEYRAAYAESHSPNFLVEAAAAAMAAGHYAAGIVAIRQAFPQLEAYRMTDIPNGVWRAAFPLPYESNLRSAAERNQLDPMLVAGLIRQESAFESRALSPVGAVGLMQLMPTTALRLARQMKVRYAHARLVDPGYNLQLGSRYLAALLQGFGEPELALAAYNAGEVRVAQWTAGQNYLESAEFVESIPFTETREYVQIVIRNSEVYRQVYGLSPAAKHPATRMVSTVPPRAEDTRPVVAGEPR